jgi:hypothetical protein
MMDQLASHFRPIYRLLERLNRESPRGLRLAATTLRGGLEASAVLRVRAEFHDSRGRNRLLNFIMKRLEGAAVREASIYQNLVSRHAQEIAPRLLGVVGHSDKRSVLYLEWVRPVRRWP